MNAAAGCQCWKGRHDGEGYDLTDRAETDLRKHCFWHVHSRVWQFFSHVGDGIWSTNGECPIQHTGQKSHTIAPPRCIFPIRPDE